MIIVSIDPGRKGAFCVWENTNCTRVIHFNSSFFVTIGKVTFFNEKILQELPPKIDELVIEKQQPLPDDTPQTAFAIGSMYASLLTAIFYKYQDSNFYFVSPQKWQRFIAQQSDAFFPDTKKLSLHFARQHIPHLLIPQRCRKEHDGIADAFCIGYFHINSSKSQ